jgi:hypothetical protein
MRNALAQLFTSRKFLVMLFTQLALLVPVVFGKIPVDLSVELATVLATAWLGAHAYEGKPKAPPAVAPELDEDVAPTLRSIPAAPRVPQIEEGA